VVEAVCVRTAREALLEQCHSHVVLARNRVGALFARVCPDDGVALTRLRGVHLDVGVFDATHTHVSVSPVSL